MRRLRSPSHTPLNNGMITGRVPRVGSFATDPPEGEKRYEDREAMHGTAQSFWPTLKNILR
jgi:hypothetical protein